MNDLPSGLTPLELARHVQTRIESATGYTRSRKHGFRWKSVAVRVTTLGMTAASTIILGLQNLNPWTGTAFSLVAVATVLGALEPFFAWRSLWVLMEEATSRFHLLHDELTYYIASVPAEELDAARIRAAFDEYQEIWTNLSTRWMRFRELTDR
ncbi:hypothetical protein Lesp02_10620 [Lentzea sp. NBRC 105346]|uniref:SLATT domain-containing protein n=1 Tax=Lentzea sp. NBRC 105346 TaxID=3032205 RepID=UPI0024A5B951|nr:SLATT domain-containing protein [Lentzea sp. NBRC 105346]GLZ28872.1 hypothetical protein Lesp02_10620 [Lentzea sp. NBRC 105346]